MATSTGVETYCFVWLDAHIKENQPDTRYTLKQLRTVVQDVTLFTRTSDCIKFVGKLTTEQAHIITSGAVGEDLVQRIHQLPQVDAIYIFCDNLTEHELWTANWNKIRGVYNRIEPVCQALYTAVRQPIEDLTPISFVSQVEEDEDDSNNEIDLNRLDPSFMYTTLFRRTLLTMKRGPNEHKAFIKFCQQQYADVPMNRSIIDDFDQNYRSDEAIRWYTRQCFVFQLLNRALRLLQSDIIVDMGFFIRDLHRQLAQLHREQLSDHKGELFTLYRGQSMSVDNFAKLKKTRGGLMSFNSFLSTSKERLVAENLARAALSTENMVGILFVITVDPTIVTTSFANIKEHSYFPGEAETLFAMNSVFRIGDVWSLDKTERLFEVQLTLTSERDPALQLLTDRLEMELDGSTGWQKLGQILIRVGQVDKAEELYLALLKQKSSARDEGLYYHCLGLIKDRQGDYTEALKYYEQAITIKEKVLAPNDPRLARSYNSIGVVYDNMGQCSQAILYFNKALTIRNIALHTDHPDVANSYNNIGSVYWKMGEYSQALSHFNKALSIRERTLPENHPDLAISYNNIASAHRSLEDYPTALTFYQQALDINERVLPPLHPVLLDIQESIEAVSKNM